MKVFEMCENQEQILKVAKDLKLDKLDFNKQVNVKKIIKGDKHKYRVIENSFVRLIGINNLVWLYFYNINNWFKTSAIKKVRKLKNGVRVTTMNSVYEITYSD